MLLLTLRETYALNRLSSFKSLRRKGGKFDHRPGRPKVRLRHCRYRPIIGAPLFMMLLYMTCKCNGFDILSR